MEGNSNWKSLGLARHLTGTHQCQVPSFPGLDLCVQCTPVQEVGTWGMCLGRKLGQRPAGCLSSGWKCPVLAPQAGVCFQEALAKLHLSLAAL